MRTAGFDPQFLRRRRQRRRRIIIKEYWGS
jgi:hypothetical protein